MAKLIKCMDAAFGESFAAYCGDSCQIIPQFADETIDFSVYSPPFQNIFVYSDSEADMGNCSTDDEFNEHYRFLVKQMLRVTKPGRLTAVHCSDLPSSKWKDGVIGLKDFPGDIVDVHCSSEVQRIQSAISAVETKAYRHNEDGDLVGYARCIELADRIREELNSTAISEGSWIFHSRTCVWRDPVVEMTRTKALGLLYKQLKKDSTRSRVGIADYVLVFRKPGENAEPVEQKPENFPVSQWQQWASPVWMDINQTNTLNVRIAKDAADEKHLCPLQLDLIERAVTLWSNPGDVVLSPFMGVGSEGVVSLKLKRKFIGVELKQNPYFKHSIRYLEAAERQDDLFLREMQAAE